MPQPANAEAAVKVVRDNLDAGAEATKLFIVTPQAGPLKRMPAEVALAAVKETHKRGKLVFAHPTDISGVEAALAAGVDILAHTTHGVESPWPEALQRKAIDQGMTLIPTLMLMGHELKKENAPADITERLIAASVAHTKRYSEAGGQVLFGTDVGYMSDFDPTEEYVLLAKAGLTPAQILASLTTTPALRWKESGKRGRVAPKMEADLVVLDADPMADVSNFAKVRCTVSGGKIVYRLPAICWLNRACLFAAHQRIWGFTPQCLNGPSEALAWQPDDVHDARPSVNVHPDAGDDLLIKPSLPEGIHLKDAIVAFRGDADHQFVLKARWNKVVLQRPGRHGLGHLLQLFERGFHWAAPSLLVRSVASDCHAHWAWVVHP